MREKNRAKDKTIVDIPEAQSQPSADGVRPGRRDYQQHSIRRILFLVLLTAIVPGLIVQALLHLNRFKSEQAREMQTHIDVSRAIAVAFRTSIEDVAREANSIGLAISRLALKDHEAASRFLSKGQDWAWRWSMGS